MTDQPNHPRRPPPPEMLRGGWPTHYTLVGHTPMAVDILTWVEAHVQRNQSIKAGTGDPWRVDRTEVGEACHVSTVFTGLDHNWHEGDPLLFETMIFGGPLDEEQDRYSTWEQAERGHADTVARARKAAAQVDALAKAAGAKQDH